MAAAAKSAPGRGGLRIESLPVDPDRFAALLERVRGAICAEDYDEIVRVIMGADEIARRTRLFDEIGVAGADDQVAASPTPTAIATDDVGMDVLRQMLDQAVEPSPYQQAMRSDPRVNYAVMFRQWVLGMYAKTAIGVLDRAGITPETWRGVLDADRRAARAMGPRYERITDKQARALARRWKFPAGRRRFETPTWLAVRLLGIIRTARTALDGGASLDAIEKLDLAILVSGNALFDAVQARAALSEVGRDKQGASAKSRTLNADERHKVCVDEYRAEVRRRIKDDLPLAAAWGVVRKNLRQKHRIVISIDRLKHIVPARAVRAAVEDERLVALAPRVPKHRHAT
jgi:hypothetical protein